MTHGSLPVEILRGADGDERVGVCQGGEDADSVNGGGALLVSLEHTSHGQVRPLAVSERVEKRGRRNRMSHTRSNSRIGRAPPLRKLGQAQGFPLVEFWRLDW